MVHSVPVLAQLLPLKFAGVPCRGTYQPGAPLDAADIVLDVLLRDLGIRKERSASAVSEKRRTRDMARRGWLAPEILIGDAVNPCPLRSQQLNPDDLRGQEDIAASRRIRDSNFYCIAHDILPGTGEAKPLPRHISSFDQTLAEPR